MPRLCRFQSSTGDVGGRKTSHAARLHRLPDVSILDRRRRRSQERGVPADIVLLTVSILDRRRRRSQARLGDPRAQSKPFQSSTGDVGGRKSHWSFPTRALAIGFNPRPATSAVASRLAEEIERAYLVSILDRRRRRSQAQIAHALTSSGTWFQSSTGDVGGRKGCLFSRQHLADVLVSILDRRRRRSQAWRGEGRGTGSEGSFNPRPATSAVASRNWAVHRLAWIVSILDRRRRRSQVCR